MQTKPKNGSIIIVVGQKKTNTLKSKRRKFKLDTVYSENNHIIMVGKVTSDKRFSHEIYGEKFYIFDLSVPRLSGNSDHNIRKINGKRRVTNRNKNNS